MLPIQLPNLHLQHADLLLRLLDGGPPVALARPAVHVLHHLAHAPLLLGDGLARLAHARLQVRVEDELEPARLARAVLLGTLLAEVAPAPVAAAPELVVKVAHCVWELWWACGFLLLGGIGLAGSGGWITGPEDGCVLLLLVFVSVCVSACVDVRACVLGMECRALGIDVVPSPPRGRGGCGGGDGEKKGGWLTDVPGLQGALSFVGVWFVDSNWCPVGPAPSLSLRLSLALSASLSLVVVVQPWPPNPFEPQTQQQQRTPKRQTRKASDWS